MSVINYIVENYQALISGVLAVLTGLIAIFMIIPGPQPEKALQSIVDVLSRFSKK